MSHEPSTSSGASQRTAQVGDVMSAPLVTCLPGVPLPEVAELMTRHRIHAVVVLADPSGSGEDDEEWGVISELDLVAGACMADSDAPGGTGRRHAAGGGRPGGVHRPGRVPDGRPPDDAPHRDGGGPPGRHRLGPRHRERPGPRGGSGAPAPPGHEGPVRLARGPAGDRPAPPRRAAAGRGDPRDPRRRRGPALPGPVGGLGARHPPVPGRRRPRRADGTPDDRRAPLDPLARAAPGGCPVAASQGLHHLRVPPLPRRDPRGQRVVSARLLPGVRCVERGRRAAARADRATARRRRPRAGLLPHRRRRRLRCGWGAPR